MLIRVVRITLRPDAVDAFKTLFDAVSGQIRGFQGCQHLELWQDLDAPHIITSYSHWESARALADYRQSDLFKETWDKVKPLFGAPAKAFSAARTRVAKAPGPPSGSAPPRQIS